jgi:putative flippase GtrA
MRPYRVILMVCETCEKLNPERIATTIIAVPIAIIGSIITGTLVSALWNLIWSYPMKLAWNYVMPQMFNLPAITFWQMFALLFLLTSLWKITPIVVK